MKKAILFVDGNMTPEEASFMASLKSQGYKTVASNGKITKGFEDSCDKVYMSKEFEHVKTWCSRNHIDFEVIGASKEDKPKATRQPKKASEPKEDETE